MPIYEFECVNCGKMIERIFSFDFSNIVKLNCDCGSKMKKVQISKSDFHLKGDGWYSTDSKMKSE